MDGEEKLDVLCTWITVLVCSKYGGESDLPGKGRVQQPAARAGCRKSTSEPKRG